MHPLDPVIHNGVISSQSTTLEIMYGMPIQMISINLHFKPVSHTGTRAGINLIIKPLALNV